MGAYKYIQKNIQESRKQRSDEYKGRLISWRKQGTVVKSEQPVNIPRARRSGYKAKKGYVVARVRIKKGRRKRPKPTGGRKARHNYRYTQPSASHLMVAEQKANRKYKNCEVLGSYLLADDGQFKYFEIILADRENKSSMSTATKRKGKAFRGLTSAGSKARKRLKTKKRAKKKDKTKTANTRRSVPPKRADYVKKEKKEKPKKADKRKTSKKKTAKKPAKKAEKKTEKK